MDAEPCAAPLSLASSQSVFVLELVSSGYFGDQIGPSFRTEGRAMLDAVLRDLNRIPGLRVETPPAADANPDLLLDSVAHHTCDAALIIAPEFDGLLEKFTLAATSNGCHSLNCSDSAIQLCSDKWRLYQHLQANGIATIPTQLQPLRASPSKFPCVVKPRDGAGSWLVRTIADRLAWHSVSEEFHRANRQEYLCQPLIAGQSLSVAAIYGPAGEFEVLPIAKQLLSDDGKFQYLGGRIPVRLSDESVLAIHRLITCCLAAISGLAGYVGLDIILPAEKPQEPFLVEINPRLTTSYIGYQELCRENLIERMLQGGKFNQPLRWHPGEIEFDPQGRWNRTRIPRAS